MARTSPSKVSYQSLNSAKRILIGSQLETPSPDKSGGEDSKIYNFIPRNPAFNLLCGSFTSVREGLTSEQLNSLSTIARKGIAPALEVGAITSGGFPFSMKILSTLLKCSPFSGVANLKSRPAVESLSLGAAVLAVALAGCSEKPEVTTYVEGKPAKAEEMQQTSEIQASTEVQTSEIGFVKPASWTDGRSSSMRLASFAADIDGEKADISIIKLAGPAGGLLANVNRWRGQVGLGNVSVSELASGSENRKTGSGEEYIFVELVNDAGGQAILGGIYERKGFMLFAKYASSAKAAAKGKADFVTFCDSVKF